MHPFVCPCRNNCIAVRTTNPRRAHVTHLVGQLALGCCSVLRHGSRCTERLSRTANVRQSVNLKKEHAKQLRKRICPPVSGTIGSKICITILVIWSNVYYVIFQYAQQNPQQAPPPHQNGPRGPPPTHGGPHGAPPPHAQHFYNQPGAGGGPPNALPPNGPPPHQQQHMQQHVHHPQQQVRMGQ
jgi:hypothetical protein